MILLFVWYPKWRRKLSCVLTPVFLLFLHERSKHLFLSMDCCPRAKEMPQECWVASNLFDGKVFRDRNHPRYETVFPSVLWSHSKDDRARPYLSFVYSVLALPPFFWCKFVGEPEEKKLLERERKKGTPSHNPPLKWCTVLSGVLINWDVPFFRGREEEKKWKKEGGRDPLCRIEEKGLFRFFFLLSSKRTLTGTARLSLLLGSIFCHCHIFPSASCVLSILFFPPRHTSSSL